MIRWFGLALVLVRFFSGLPPGPGAESPNPVRPEGFTLVKTIRVPGASGWTDAGLDVLVDQEFWFEASGTICLQTGNPEAYCGPDGIKIRTMQQPLPEENLGSLAGRILQDVTIIEDPKTKEKTIREFGVVFAVGKAGRVRIPADGKLFLGPNENVTGDNDGAFSVLIYRRDGAAQSPFLRARNFSRN